MSGLSKQLHPPSELHLREMMGWFNSEAELREWAGPQFNYPFTQATFEADLTLTQLASFSLLNSQAELLAFGQAYQRLKRWHLGRLVVSPKHRGQGIVQGLIEQLSQVGRREHKIFANSLFVMKQNVAAIKAYQRCGFVIAEYPQPMPMQETYYMIRDDT